MADQETQDDLQVRMGNLPDNFFERVVDLENKIGGRDYNEDEAGSVTMISELMRLYSVSFR